MTLCVFRGLSLVHDRAAREFEEGGGMVTTNVITVGSLRKRSKRRAHSLGGCSVGGCRLV
ncbi:hypothetical protein M408DRAFT_121635 [Serendipita vermifera MAFF 305830]|uniref:Uncharacterized protein n=1 Tax=Serendipita vermifera MAFF 305830 TaxID=933852 RepID=A0A0C2XJP8_SERVB|nr:hypothetical protein M408DRAFT_121635 [Serendipita vermifera MAFF 305830]